MNKEHDAPQTAKTTKTKQPIENLRVYQQARQLEDKVHKLVEALPQQEYYLLGNDLRRASAACAHFIAEAHERYSYSLKTESFHEARRQAEDMVGYLIQYQDRKFGDTKQLVEEYTGVIKQSWGLIKWLKGRQQQNQVKAAIKAADELVAARS